MRRHNLKRGMAGCLAAVLLLGGTACTANKATAQTKPYVVGAVTKSADSEYWMSVCSGMEKAATDFGISVIILSPESESDDKAQKKMIHDLIQKGVDALAVSPIQSYDTAYLQEAEEKQIPVVSYDTRIVKEKIPYVGIDNQKVGEELAKTMAQQMGNVGKVGIVSGDLNQAAHKERVDGIRSYLKENTAIQIAFVESGYSNLLMSEKEIARLMQVYADVDGIFVTSAVTALGIMEYMRGTSVRIMTVDAQQDTIEAVKNGDIAALAAQSGYDIGYAVIQYIAEHRGKEIMDSADKILDVEIVTAENIGTWKG